MLLTAKENNFALMPLAENIIVKSEIE